MAVISLILSSLLLLAIIHTSLADVFVYNDANKLVVTYDDQTAGFGPPFPSEGIQGHITTTDPENACKEILPPPSILKTGYHWIALIPRTQNESCDFDLKVKNAQDANFSAVIIYNYENALIPMAPHGRYIRIPATLISKTDGLSIISNYLYNKTSVNLTPIYHIKIKPEQTFKIGIYLIPFLVIIGTSFLALTGFMLVKCCLERRRARRHRLPRSALKKLKIKKFVKGDPWEVCAICLDDYENGAKLRILPCDHAYHMKCIDPWLVNSRRQCPVCKRYVFPNHDHSDEEENSGHPQQARTPTEQTPLIQPTENNLSAGISRIRQLSERRLLNPSGTGAPNISLASNESSDSGEDPSSPSATTNSVTTTELHFDRSLSNSRRYPQRPLPRQSNTNENDSAPTTYGSVQDSPTTSFISPRVDNFFVSSVGGDATNNANVSARSAVEDATDNTTTDDDDEQMHSVITGSEDNTAYVNDEGSIKL